MHTAGPKADLHRYLQVAREALLWKLDGLGEYDVRRPMVATGTNLLGLVKRKKLHNALVELLEHAGAKRPEEATLVADVDRLGVLCSDVPINLVVTPDSAHAAGHWAFLTI